MFGVNGLEFVQAVRADASFAGLPLMMVTTETELAQMVTALEAGANAVCYKPFDVEKLLSTVHELSVR
mgnify:CR=1 FL=1